MSSSPYDLWKRDGFARPIAVDIKQGKLVRRAMIFGGLFGLGVIAYIALTVPDFEGPMRILMLVCGVAIMVGDIFLARFVFSPRLIIMADGLAVGSPLWRRNVAWHEVESVASEQMDTPAGPRPIKVLRLSSGDALLIHADITAAELNEILAVAKGAASGAAP